MLSEKPIGLIQSDRHRDRLMYRCFFRKYDVTSRDLKGADYAGKRYRIQDSTHGGHAWRAYDSLAWMSTRTRFRWRCSAINGMEPRSSSSGRWPVIQRAVRKVIRRVCREHRVVAGYEAGCMGYHLQRVRRHLAIVDSAGAGRSGETDRRDAVAIARLLRNREGSGCTCRRRRRLEFYNEVRPHSALDGRTPNEVYRAGGALEEQVA